MCWQVGAGAPQHLDDQSRTLPRETQDFAAHFAGDQLSQRWRCPFLRFLSRPLLLTRWAPLLLWPGTLAADAVARDAMARKAVARDAVHVLVLVLVSVAVATAAVGRGSGPQKASLCQSIRTSQKTMNLAGIDQAWAIWGVFGNLEIRPREDAGAGHGNAAWATREGAPRNPPQGPGGWIGSRSYSRTNSNTKTTGSEGHDAVNPWRMI